MRKRETHRLSVCHEGLTGRTQACLPRLLENLALRRSISRFLVLALVGGSVFVGSGAQGQAKKPGDWPQWRGPNRDGISRETGLAKSWPAEGPPLSWRAEGLGGGYGTLTVAAGRVYGMGFRGNDEVVWALDENNAKGLWLTRINNANRGIGYPEGSRCAPTFDGGKLYVLGVSGDLACVDAATGKMEWQHNLVSRFGGRVPNWGYSESPLIEGDRVIVAPGGGQATIIAFNKNSGAEAWRSQVPGGDPAHYASAIAADAPGGRQIIHFLGGGVVGVAAATGKFLWRYNKPANGTANCSTPIYRDGHVFAASSYNVGGGLVKLTAEQDGSVSATEVYFTRQMQNHHGGMLVLGDYLYGCDQSTLTCLNLMTGQPAWAARSVGKCSLTSADGMLYIRSERGPIALAQATHTGYVERSRFDQPELSGKNTWAHPVVANGHLYIRDQEVLFRYDVRAK